MQWIHTTQRGQRFRRGLARWTSAGSPRIANWRWHARPYEGSPVRLCPLRRFCPERDLISWDAEAQDEEAGPAGAGSFGGPPPN